ncbi:hypothetical protein N665_0606s0016 [Sinapis alba]|nr:hypothetical protein N665_0606s0016 [Sinapis alba]
MLDSGATHNFITPTAAKQAKLKITTNDKLEISLGTGVVVSGYFGKVGMRYFHKLRNKFFCPIVNLDKLWSLVPEDVKAKSTKDKVPLIDVTQHGFFKVLGKGHLPENKPFVVKAKLISKTAEKKIKEAGGAVVLTA